MGFTVPSLKLTWFAPWVRVSVFALIFPFSSVARLIISTYSAPFPSRPLLPIITEPFLTANASRAPCLSNCGLPVVRVTEGVLINPHPSQVIPFGLAIITPALLPKTSSLPFNSERLPLVTSLMISSAGLPFKLALPLSMVTPSWVFPPCVALFNTAPGVPVLKS
ncbi:Uncharacterised protein [Klebsiella variicola]|nr:Uncharacterised protein [Klebsiella variicola]